MTRLVVLIIAPEGSSRDTFANDLRNAGCRVSTAADGSAGEQTALAARPDVIVVSERLPDADSLDVCRRIRSRALHDASPVFLLTPNDLSAGAGVLVGWNKRRHEANNGAVICGELTMDSQRHYATIAGRELSLTPMEFRLLETLARQPGRVFTRQQLYGACRGEQTTVQDRTIDVHVKSIRQKLQSHSELLQTVHGIGYRMKQPLVVPAR